MCKLNGGELVIVDGLEPFWANFFSLGVPQGLLKAKNTKYFKYSQSNDYKLKLFQTYLWSIKHSRAKQGWQFDYLEKEQNQL